MWIKEVSEEFDLWGCVVHDDGDDVEAMWFVLDAEHLSIDTRGTRDLAPLAFIDVDLRWREPVGRARLYFDEAKRVAVVTDQIDFSIDDCAAQVAADGKREVGSDESIAELIEICSGVRFAEVA